MKLYPAIDLKDQNCVRLFKGDMEQATVFSNAPGEQAAQFEAEGAEYLHVVDLNGAFAGAPVNLDAVKEIRKSISIPMQLGGGIRDVETIETWLEAGVNRVILGTIALRNPALVKQACKAFPGQICVGIDMRGGYVAVEGWAETSNMLATDLATEFEDAGVAAIIFTDIDRDGAMQGANMEATKDFAEHISIPVILSGGISSMEDITAAKALQSAGVEGVISGRAIYDGAIDIAKAQEILGA